MSAQAVTHLFLAGDVEIKVDGIDASDPIVDIIDALTEAWLEQHPACAGFETWSLDDQEAAGKVARAWADRTALAWAV